MMLYQAKDIRLVLEGRAILQDVNFDLQAGEIVGLIGPNGAGKSTLIKCLTGLLKPDSGKIFFKGENISKVEARRLAREMSYLPQGQLIHWPLKVSRLVSLGRIPHLLPWDSLSARDEQVVRQAMTSTDTLHLENRTVDHLAGGEKTLVMLARAIANEPSVILADEPVAGLDPNHQIQVMDLLRNFAAKGAGIVVVLHDLTLAARFCDRLHLIHQGKILACGTPRTVLKEENLRASYAIEAKYGQENDDFFVVPWSRLS